MEGKPVAGATIVFVPASSGAETAVGVSDAEGKYKLTTFSDGDGAQPGDYRIKVSKYDNKPPSAEESQRYVSLEEEAKTYTEDERPSPPSKNLLPPKYADESASGITHTVKDGPTTLDIKLE